LRGKLVHFPLNPLQSPRDPLVTKSARRERCSARAAATTQKGSGTRCSCTRSGGGIYTGSPTSTRGAPLADRCYLCGVCFSPVALTSSFPFHLMHLPLLHLVHLPLVPLPDGRCYWRWRVGATATAPLHLLLPLRAALYLTVLLEVVSGRGARQGAAPCHDLVHLQDPMLSVECQFQFILVPATVPF
jgi:hypothetical protein